MDGGNGDLSHRFQRVLTVLAVVESQFHMLDCRSNNETFAQLRSAETFEIRKSVQCQVQLGRIAFRANIVDLPRETGFQMARTQQVQKSLLRIGVGNHSRSQDLFTVAEFDP